MTEIMNGLATIVSKFFDLLLAPMAGYPALAMIVVSVFSAVWALLLFKAVTPQAKLAAGRDRLFGNIFELGLYQDHLSVLGKIQRDLALSNLRYLMLTLPALLALTLPMVLTLAQLDSRFSHRPMNPGEPVVFSLKLNPETNVVLNELNLVVPGSLVVEAGPVRNTRDGEIAWRLRGEKAGEHRIQVMHKGAVLAERIFPVGNDLQQINVHNKTGVFAKILAPGAQALARDGIINEMTLHLPKRSTTYLGLEMDWLIAFMLFSMVGGLLLKDVLKVSL